ncbi:hypothetical protein ACFWA9_29215 [Kitasatospora sp. NPDC059973]|uniref:hypothetical protein n=1 Tax=Kitasatospora sp. NPDC059973 TaxID=3347020 RepID=UPI00367B627D
MTTTAPRPAELADAIEAAAADQRVNYPELSVAEAVELIRHYFFVVEDCPDNTGNGAWGVSATAQDPLERAYARVVRATPEELASVLTS